MMSRPSQRESASVEEAIRDAILLGTIRSSEPLREKVLQRQFCATRSPIRQALARLQDEGIAVMTEHHGLCVVNPRIEDLQAALIARMGVEALIVWNLVGKLEAGEAELTSLESSHRRLARINTDNPTNADRISFLKADLAFHETAAEIAGHALAIPIIRRTYYCNVISIPGAAGVLPGSGRAIVSEHEQLLSALRKRNRVDAVLQTQSHLVEATNRWFPFLNRFLFDDLQSISELLGTPSSRASGRSKKKRRPAKR